MLLEASLMVLEGLHALKMLQWWLNMVNASLS